MFSENFWNGFFKVAGGTAAAWGQAIERSGVGQARRTQQATQSIKAHINAIPAAGKQVFEAPAAAAATALKEKPVKTLLSRKIKDATNKESWMNMNRR